MKKVLVLFAVVLMCAGVASAQLFTEDFSYTTGQALTANGWTAHSSGGTNPILVSASGLSYSGYASGGIGKAATTAVSGEDLNRSFASQTSGSVYASFLVSVTSTSTTGEYFFHLIQAPATSNVFCPKVFAKQDGSNNLAFGVSKRNNTATATYSGFTYSLNTTYLIVVKYTFNTGSTIDDGAELWINPTLNISEPASDLVAADETTPDASELSLVGIRQGTAGNTTAVIIDGIRIATSWDGIPLPVEISSFTATAKGRGVELVWKTATEINNLGFDVEKNVSGSWSKIGFVEGHGTTNAPQSYTFVDASAKGTVSYRLKQIDRDGQFEYHNAVEVTVAKPAVYALDQNYPNPFNPSTAITYSVPNTGKVMLSVYDMLGKEVASLVNGVVEAGEHTAQFNASQLPSGMYFYTIRTNNFTETKKMLLVK